MRFIGNNCRYKEGFPTWCRKESKEKEVKRKDSSRSQRTTDRRRESDPDPDPGSDVRVELQGSDLWKRFHEIGTEMIITKAGRRMFPSVRVKVKNLDPFKQYYMAVDIMPVDSKRYRYVYHSSQWMVAGNTDHSCIAPRLYVHPDSPCSGETLMRQVVSFDRVKLTNNEMDDKGHVILQSMHKYKPRVHVIEHDPRVDLSRMPSLPAQGVHSFSFPETQFTTVTAYQNQQITKLKIDRNPFAKGFRDPGRNRGVLDGILESYPWRNQLTLDLKPFSLELQGGNPGPLAGCAPLPPLKNLLSHSCTPTSSIVPLSCPDTTLYHIPIPLCYKMSPTAGLLAGRVYGGPDADRLRGCPGLRPLVDLPCLSALHGKKAGSCRGQCLQEPVAHSACLLSLPGLQATRGTGLSRREVIPVLPSPCALYSCALPLTPQFAPAARHSKLAASGSAAGTESLLRQTPPWQTSINHCL
uniref:T-box domain-containing protein n=1 Tax=Denticeps clupeoides TaxID=299321 RepID=A0AAY4E738_9TELE